VHVILVLIYIVSFTGSVGNLSNTLNKPYAFTRDSNSGTLYISDTLNNRVMRYLSGASSGSVVAGDNGGGTSNTQLYQPIGLYFDSPSNSLIIANSAANNIICWTIGALSWTLIAGNINGVAGNSSTQFNAPMGVTLDPMGNVYVADESNHRIQFFPIGETSGTTIAGITGIMGNNSTMLYNPLSVALDSQLNLYVADAFNSRVQKFVRY
jgi:sugar lactone lactonase YvrE